MQASPVFAALALLAIAGCGSNAGSTSSSSDVQTGIDRSVEDVRAAIAAANEAPAVHTDEQPGKAS